LPLPVRAGTTSLGLAALRAQDAAFQLPAADAHWAGPEWAERYFVPLAQSDLVCDHVQEHTTITQVIRHLVANDELLSDRQRFELLASGPSGAQRYFADAIIDATGWPAAGPTLNTTPARDTRWWAEIAADLSRVTPAACCATTTDGVPLTPPDEDSPTAHVSLRAALFDSGEPGFYVIGSKSCAQVHEFSIADGHRQIQLLFSLLADRLSLNLYANLDPLIKWR